MARLNPYLEAAKTDEFLDEGIRGYIFKTAKKEFWRVAEWYELDDLIEDGYLAYYKCRNRYLDEIKKSEPELAGQKKWMMALVSRAFFNHISTLASKRTAVHERAVSQMVKTETGSTDGVWDSLLPAQQEEASFMTLLANSPAEIKQLIQLLATDVEDVFNFQRKWVGRIKLRETNNEFFCRVLELDPATNDLVGQLKSYFG